MSIEHIIYTSYVTDINLDKKPLEYLTELDIEQAYQVLI